MPANLTIFQRQEVFRHFNAAKTVHQVCKFMGVHRSTVYRILQQQRVRDTLETKKGQGDQPGKVTKMNLRILREKIRRNPEKNWTTLARKMSMSESSVRRLAKKGASCPKQRR